MVVDSSAIAAVLFGEPGSDRYIDAIASGERLFMSAVNRLEIGIVAEARKGEAGAAGLAALLSTAEVEVLPFDASQAEVALAAYRRYGKSRHPASLNLGDCAAYTLAMTMNQRLLYKGDDFSKTDVAMA